MELREPSTEPLLRLFETPISLSSRIAVEPVISAPCADTSLPERMAAAHQSSRAVLLEAQAQIEAELYQLAQRTVYGTTYSSQKTRRNGGEAMATPFEQVEQEIFEVCRSDHSYRRIKVIETAHGKIGTRYKYINPKDGTGSYRKALEREAACRPTMERVKRLKEMRQKVLSRLSAIDKREADDQALLKEVLDI